MSVFEFSDYRPFLKDLFSKSPHKGRGKYQELARYLRIHPVVVSQIFSGTRDFSEEQAIEICEYLELTPLEGAYLRLLVRLSKAGTHKLKKLLKEELEELKRASRSLATRVKADKTLSDSERAVFYSSWLYPASRLYCSTKATGKSVDEVADRLGISRVRASDILEFLVSAGLVELENGKFKIGSQSTFVDKKSPHLARHLSNWRIKAIQTIDNLSDEELMFSAPLSISKGDFVKLREGMADFIKNFAKSVEASPPEEIACINIDFFWIRK